MGTNTGRPFKWLFYENVETKWAFNPSRFQYLRNICEHLAEKLASKNYGIVIATRPSELGAILDTIQFLNEKGIPVKVWLVNSDFSGYWTHVGNVRVAINWLHDLENSVARRGLRIEGVGLDLEYPIRIARIYDDPGKLVKELIEFHRDVKTQKARAMDELRQAIQSATHPIEFYVFQRGLHSLIGGGLEPVGKARVVSMDYTSLLPTWAQRTAYWILRKLAFPNSITALGIIGTREGETPGRLLGKNLPKHHTYETLRSNLSVLRKMRGGELPDEMYFFALDGVETIEIIEEAIARS